MIRNWLLLSGFLILVLMLAIGLQRDPSLVSSPLIDQTIPAFEGPRLLAGDQKFDSSTLRGEWSLLNVWASWCPTCLDEHALLMRWTGQIATYGINYKDDHEDALEWLQKYGNPYRFSAFDESGDIAIELGVYKTPETFLLDPQGVIRYKHVGALTEEAWQNEILPRVRGENS